jgi:hypothetical protein
MSDLALELGHAYMQHVQMMIRTPNEALHHERLLFPEVKTGSSCDHPLVQLVVSPSLQDTIQATFKALIQVTEI